MPTPNFNFPTILQTDTANVPRDLNALANSLDTAFQQTEYQTASIVGTQIRLTKPSASSRIFFKLGTSINSGTPITISLDGGATSKNLVDADSLNITQLDKGLLEVVAEATFFTLRSSGGISNAQKSELVAKIGAPAAMTDSFAALMTKMQDAKDVFGTKIGVPNDTALLAMANALIVGKQWKASSMTSANNAVVVSDLTFQPKLIIVRDLAHTALVGIGVHVVGGSYPPLPALSFFLRGADNVSVPTVSTNATGFNFYDAGMGSNRNMAYLAIS